MAGDTMTGLRTCAALGAVLLLAACGGAEGPPPPPVPTLVLDHVESVVAPSGFPDVITGCLPHTNVRVFLGEQGYYSAGMAVAAVTDTTCTQALVGWGGGQ
jgi:hypothetical protein